MELAGRVALVTGGGTGLGRAIALRLAGAGCHIAVNYAHSEADAHETTDALRALGVRACAVQADVSDPAAVRRLVEETESAVGPIDVLVNNAGITRGIPFADLDAVTVDDWTSLFSVNVIGAFLCAQAVAPSMAERGCGAILNVGSKAPYVALGSSIPYTVSKAALLSLTQCLSRALPPTVRVNLIAPSFMDTRWLERNLDPALLARVRAGELPSVDVDEVAAVALELIRNDTIGGQEIVLDGGELWRTT